jgi:bifunctional non-homologous end joining protein LigD
LSDPGRREPSGKGRDGLGAYERKRDFEATPEPAPRRRRRRPAAPRFVVQEHSARRLHWDLRLEHEGVAASWAIPNGIPEDPGENRKAVHTEDHPLEYLEFEGEIPAGNYGAGTMRIWDQGTYECHKWEPGKVVFSFRGRRVSGRYALFRAGKAEKDWMIHRVDPAARERDPFPEQVVPMSARPGDLPAEDRDWAVEVRWEGERAIAYCRPGRLSLQGRNLDDITARYPEVRRLARQLGSRDAVLDGELVVFAEDGRPSLERLRRRLQPASESTVRRRMKSDPVTYVIFDLLYLDGRGLIDETYRRRRELLEDLELSGDNWQTPGYSRGRAEELLRASAEQGLEGVVLKRLDSRYAPGKRDGSWLAVASAGSSPREKPAREEARVVPPATAGAAPRKRLTVNVAGTELHLSNLDKVLYPRTGFTKGDLIEWYARIGETVLPHLRDRPLTLKRYPDGVEGKHFYEKRCPKHRPEWVETVSVWSDTHNGEIDFCVVNDLPTLVWAANLADIELHTSLSRATEMERPTAIVFDLDPGAPADARDCAQVAIWIRGLFEQLGLRCYPKTSGSKGLQIYVPLNTDVTYAQTKPFAKAVAETLERRFPERVVSRMAKSKRPGKVLVDWSQNDRHKTTANVYSLRARTRPTVSTPLEWEEVEAGVEAASVEALVFDHAAVLARVESKGDLFAPLLSEKQDLPDA